MIAAIYTRKSQDQPGVADEAKSVSRQVEHACAYAARKGWMVDETRLLGRRHLGRRVPTPARIPAADELKPRSPFSVLVMMDEDRLGPQQMETAWALKQLITAGVRVFSYLQDRERTLDSPTEKLLLSVTSFADELEREKARQRTHDAMLRKAKAGHVTGGRVFGYTSVPVLGPPDADGTQTRLHVARQIHEGEADVVRRIFELRVAGRGLTAIATILNEEGALAPRPRRGPVQGWVSSSVRAILHRPLYRGDVVWNRTKKRDSWSRRHQCRRPEGEHVSRHDPSLRIVPEDLWQGVQRRLRTTREAYLGGTSGHLHGRPPTAVESKYLLTGLVTCGACGGTLYVHSRSHGRGRREHRYGCTSYHLRGRKACANNLEIPIDVANLAVLQMLQRDLLHPTVIGTALRKAYGLLASTSEDGDRRRHELQNRLAQLDDELRPLTAALAQGEALGPIIEAIKARELERGRLRDERAHLDATPVQPIDPLTLRRVLRTRLVSWIAGLRRPPSEARHALRPCSRSASCSRLGRTRPGGTTRSPGSEPSRRCWRASSIQRRGVPDGPRPWRTSGSRVPPPPSVRDSSVSISRQMAFEIR
jgi:site-specific DNA recombinase